MWKSTIFALFAALVAISEATTSLGCYLKVSVAESMGDYKYQSPSYCQQQCADYAYVALMAGDICYCLDSFPSGDTTTGCSTSCFGYGLDTCGGNNVYDVYAGTGSQGALTAAVLASSSSSLTTLSTSTKSSSSTSSSSSLESSSLHSTTSASSSSTASTSSDASTSLALGAMTASVTATSTVTSSPTPSSTQKKSTNVGPIVGGVVGGVAALALIAVGGFFLLRRMRSEDDEDDEYYEPKAVSRGALKKKNVLDMPLQNPLNPFAHPSDAISGHGGLTDPRMNLTMMGRKRLLEGTLADEADYSRKILQVINPDH